MYRKEKKGERDELPVAAAHTVHSEHHLNNRYGDQIWIHRDPDGDDHDGVRSNHVHPSKLPKEDKYVYYYQPFPQTPANGSPSECYSSPRISMSLLRRKRLMNSDVGGSFETVLLHVSPFWRAGILALPETRQLK